jgi:hypothetical protein
MGGRIHMAGVYDQARDQLETGCNIANKISGGEFTAAFLLECFVAIGAQSLRLGS